MKDGAGGSLGELLRDYRRRAGLTQEEVANLAAVSVAGLRDIEQGRVQAPRSPTLHRLGVALGLSETEVAGLAERPPPVRAPTDRFSIGVLGPLVVRVDGAEVDPGSEVQRVLLGLLALSPNTPVARERLLGRIAAAGRPATAGALAARMSRLRRRLRPAGPVEAPGPAVLAIDGGYELRVTDGQLDLLAFQSLVRAARRSQAAGELPQAWDRYVQAVRLWRGEPLAGLTMLADDPAVVGLVRQWPPVAADFASVGIELGRSDEVVPVLRRVTALDPLHEIVHARLMVALTAAGRQAEALEVFDRLRRRLDRDLGTVPGPELVRAHRRVLRQEVAPPPAAALRAYHTLPPDLPGFIGREPQSRWLAERVPCRAGGAGDPRRATVITIEGDAGVGKSRLAIHFAHRLVAEGRYAAQQLYADLAGPVEPADVLASFLQLLGVPPGQLPAGLDGRVAVYRERLRATPVLVVLDHASDPARVTPLLPGGPDSLTLVTSRLPLALPGSHRLPLATFTRPEALAALAAAVGPERVDPEPAAAERLVEAGGRSPLAVAMIAARLQARPAWTITDAAARLCGPLARWYDERPRSAPGADRWPRLDDLRDYFGEAW